MYDICRIFAPRNIGSKKKELTKHDSKAYLSCKQLTCGGYDTDLEKFQVTYDYETGNLLSRKRNANAQSNYNQNCQSKILDPDFMGEMMTFGGPSFFGFEYLF